MEINQSTVRFGARTKLFRRHVQEWNILLVHQKQVLLLTKEHMQQLDESSTENRTGLAFIIQLTNQALHLAQVRTRQTDDRQDLKTRHKLETFALEQSIDSY